MRTIVGNKDTKKQETKTQRLSNIADPEYKVPTNVSQYAASGLDIKELETAKHWASEAEKSAQEAADSASKSETFMNITIEAANSVQDNTEDSFNYLEEIRQISVKIDGQEERIDESEAQVILHADAAEAAAAQADTSAAQARDSEANSAASASSANNSAIASKESEQAAEASKNSAADSATEAGEKLAQTEAVYDKTIDDVSKAVQSYLKDKGGFDPSAGLPTPDSWFDIFGVQKNLSCLWVADVAGVIPETGTAFNEGDILIYNAIVDRYGRFSGELVTAGGGGGPTEFFNDVILSEGKKILGTDSKGSPVELIKLTLDDIVEAGDKTKVIRLLSKDRNSAFVTVANSKSTGGFDDYQIYHKGNKPTAADVGAYTKAESNTKFVDITGDSMTGDLTTTAKFITKGNEVYHPLNKPTPSALGAVSKTGDTMTGVLNANGNIEISNAQPTISFRETDKSNKVWQAEVNGGNFQIDEAGVAPRMQLLAGGEARFSGVIKHQASQGTTADSVTRKDYVDAIESRKYDKTGGTISGEVIVSNKITVEGTGSLFKDIDTVGQVKEGGIRVYSPNNKPNAVDVGALPISGGTIGGSLDVIGNLSEKGKRVYSPNNKPTPNDVGAVSRTGDTMTGDLTIAKTNGKIKFTSTVNNSLAGFSFTNAANQNLDVTHIIGDGDLPMPGQALKFTGSGATNHLITDGEFFARNDKQVYHQGFKPTAADVGAIGVDNVYDKTQADARFWKRTETVNRSFETDKVRTLGFSASDFKGVDNFRSYLNTDGYTGYPDSYGSGIFQGRTSNSNSHGWSLYSSTTNNRLLSYGKQKLDGSGFDWYKIYTEANKPSAADVDAYSRSESDSRYVNSSGDTMTGILNANGNIKISRSAPILTLHETDFDKSFMFVADGDSVRLNRYDTGTTNANLIWQWRSNADIADGGQLELINPVTRSVQGVASSSLTRKDYVDSQVNTRLPLTGGTLSGDLKISDTKSIYLGNLSSNSPKITGNGYDLGIVSVSDITIHANSDLGTASGDEALNLKASSNHLKVGTTSGLTYNGKNVYTEHSFSVDVNPTVNSVVKRTGTSAIAGSSFVSASNFRNTVSPKGAVYRGSSSVTGSIKITLPRAKSATMIKMYISVYNYKTDTSFDAIISGYETSQNSIPHWTQTSAVIYGGKETVNHPVYFGTEDSKSCIWIGSVGSAWAYPHVVINRIDTGYSGGNNDAWSEGWSITPVTALGSVVRTVSDALIKPGGANVPADEQPTANTLIKRNAKGEAAVKGRLLIASSNDSDVSAGLSYVDFVSAAGNSFGKIGDAEGNSSALSIKTESPLRILTIGGVAQKIHTGGLLTSSSYGDASKIPINGIYAKGDIKTGGNITAKTSVYVEHPNDPIYSFVQTDSNLSGYIGIKDGLFVRNPGSSATRYKIYNESFKPTAADVGALALVGGTLTGKVWSTVDSPAAFVARRGGYEATFGLSSTVGDYLFGGAPTGKEYDTYLRMGNGKFEYYHLGTIRKIYHEGFKPTAADVGALSLTGGNVNGNVNISGLVKPQIGLVTNAADVPGAGIYICDAGTTAGDAYDDYSTVLGVTTDRTSRHFQLQVSNDGVAFKVRAAHVNASDPTKFHPWYRVYTEAFKPTSSDVGLSNLSKGGNGELLIQTSHGNVSVGPINGGHCHYITDRSNHYFNKELRVNGEIYCGASYAQRVYHQGYKPSAADIGALASNGTAAAATKLATARQINGVNFDGTNNINVGELRGGNYNSGGTEKPNWFGAGKMRYQMLGGTNGGASNGLGAYSDALWISSYTGGDVKRCNLLLMSKDSPRIGFRQANFDATAWGDLYEIYHTGKKPSAGDVGALPLSGGTVTGNVKFNGVVDLAKGGGDAIICSALNSSRKQLIAGSASGVYVGNPTAQLILETSAQIKLQQGSTSGFIYSTVNKPSAGDVGALPLSGGTMSGSINYNNYGACGFSAGNGDGGSFSTNNIRINSWFGVGIWCTQGTQRYSHYFNARTGDFGCLGNVTAFSDRRVKDNIKNIPNALDKVMKLNGVTYTRTDQEDKGKLHTGLIAQEVEAVLPEAVHTSENGDIKDFKSVAYGNLVGLLVEAIKELKQEVEDLKNGNANRNN